MKPIFDLVLSPVVLLALGAFGLTAVLALVFKVPFFAGVWGRLTGLVDSIAKELDSNWHEMILLALLFLVDRQIFAVVAGAYLIARVIVDAYLTVRKS